jgi:DNA-binding transcriptional regulator YiaG
MAGNSDQYSVSDPPEGLSPPAGWEDYEVPLTATGIVVVRAQSKADAADWAREQGDDLLPHVSMTADEGMETNARPNATDTPENVESGDGSNFVPSVPTMSQLVEAREREELTQAEVAAELDVSPGTVSNWDLRRWNDPADSHAVPGVW